MGDLKNSSVGPPSVPTGIFPPTHVTYACCWQIYVAILIYPHLVLLAWIVIVFDPTRAFWIYI